MLQKVNLLHILFHLDFGGVATVVKKFTEGLDSSKYNQSVLCIARKGVWADEIESKGNKVFLIEAASNGFDWGMPFKIASLLKQEANIDIIHTHSELPGIYGAAGAKIAGVPLMIGTQHSRFFVSSKSWILRFKIASLMTNKIVCVSNDAKENLINVCNINSSKLEVITNGIDCSEFAPCFNKSILSEFIFEPEKYKIIGSVGRLSPEKDYNTLLIAFSLLIKKMDKIKLIIVGDGVTGDELKQSAKELGIEKDVLFLGKRSEIKLLLNSFDLFVVSSKIEGISIALLEAMACGLPVVATDVGGNPNVLVDGKTGVLVPTGNPGKMSDAMLQILSSEDSIKMGKQGRQRVLEKFSLDYMMSNYMALYEQEMKKLLS